MGMEGGVGSYGKRRPKGSRGGGRGRTDREMEERIDYETTSIVEEDCGGEQVNSMAAGFM